MNDLVIDQQAADVSHVEPDRPRQVAVRPADPFALLVQAVDKGMDPAQLKALVDLQEQWRAARAKEAFAAAMNAVQAEMPCIVRDANNEQTKSRYVRMETVTHQGKAIYTKHGFSLSFSEDESGIEKFKRIVCLVRHNEGHSERHWIDLPLDGFGAKGNAIGAMNPVQAAISTGSYGQRVLTCRVFNITIADTDLDGAPLAPNPDADPSAPKAQPRGKRTPPQPAQPTAVSKQQLDHLWAHWLDKHKPEDGNLQTAKDKFGPWVHHFAGRTFNHRDLPSWGVDDYTACLRALNIEDVA